MSPTAIVAVHPGLIRRPLKLAFQMRTEPGKKIYEVCQYDTYPALVLDLYTRLQKQDETILERIAELDDARFMQSKHKTRRYVADRRDLLYINAEHLENKSKALLGHWIATNIGRNEAMAMVGFACRAANVSGKSLYSLKIADDA